MCVCVWTQKHKSNPLIRLASLLPHFVSRKTAHSLLQASVKMCTIQMMKDVLRKVPDIDREREREWHREKVFQFSASIGFFRHPHICVKNSNKINFDHSLLVDNKSECGPNIFGSPPLPSLRAAFRREMTSPGKYHNSYMRPTKYDFWISEWNLKHFIFGSDFRNRNSISIYIPGI